MTKNGRNGKIWTIDLKETALEKIVWNGLITTFTSVVVLYF